MGTIDELIAALQALKLKQDHVDKLWAADVRTIVDGIIAAMDMGGSSDIDITTEQIEGGTRVTITDAEGTQHTFDVKDGDDAYEVYKSTVPSGETPMSKADWLASLKGATPTINQTTKHWEINGSDTGILAEGHNPNRGTYNVGDTFPSDGIAGDYIVVVDDTQSTPTAEIYKWDATQNDWDATGVSPNDAAFEDGQLLPNTKIDNTALANPAANALAKARDVMGLAAKMEGVTAEKVLFDGTGGTVTTGKKISNEGVISDSANESIIAINVQGCKKVSFYGYRAVAAHTYGYAVYSSASVFDASTLLLSFGYDSDGSSGNYYRWYDVLLPENAVTLVCMYNKANFNEAVANFRGVKYRGETVTDNVQSVDVKIGDAADYREVPYYRKPYKITGYVKVNASGGYDTSVHDCRYVEFATEGSKGIRFLGVCFRAGLFTYEGVARYYAFGHYEEGVWVTDLVENYKFDFSGDTNVMMEYVHDVPAQSTHARLLCGYPNLYYEDAFYCYLYSGTKVTTLLGEVQRTGDSRVLTEMDVPNYADEMGSAINAYLNNTGQVLSTTNTQLRVFYLKVMRGERYLFVVEPTEEWTNQNNNAVFGYLDSVPAVGSGYVLSNVVSGIVATTTSTTGADHQPATLRMQWVAPKDGFLCYYYKGDLATVKIYKDSVEQRVSEALYDTYVEEDVYYRKLPTTTSSNVCEKAYIVKPGIEYKLIYQQKSSQGFNSWSQYDGAGALVASSSDSSATGDLEHIMESIVIRPNTRILVMRFSGTATEIVGTNDRGMAALMKPLKDDGTLPKNDIVYFVSRIKSNPIANGIDDNVPGTTVVEDMWSAWGVKFPKGHNLSGKPTPLVGHFHGTGGLVTSECLSYVYRYGTYMHELINNAGMAVFDVNGRGVSFASDYWEQTNYPQFGVHSGDRQLHWGSPAAVATAKKAYEVLTERFNCRKGMMIGCTSMGGCLVESYANAYPKDLVAAYMCAPAVLGVCIRTANYRNGVGVGRAWGATGDHAGDISLALGYTSWVNLVVKEEVQINENTAISYFTEGPSNITDDDLFNNRNGIRDKIFAPFPVELVVWQGTADTNVKPRFPMALVAAARRAGSNAKIRLCEGYEHPLMDFYPEVVDYIKSKLLI